ncbi:hypothetical protein K457DRAFT_143477 [Linnemannia elongata AG-77]|uniref:Uncharacterized protein n=1 Tax=Linnemannia elongata AG-77 TaxID=1314771 RepID=A0A197JB80_9FUNG|nr:hypothetical protein K457DRAFT_143477 [Linnemannia elongata AG-77]
MFKTILLLSGLVTIGAFAQTWSFDVTNNAGKTASSGPIEGYERFCLCLKTTQTSKIHNTHGGVMKLFSTDDCTGNFVSLPLGSTRSNSQWVNSASVGVDGIPSFGPTQCDPITY